MKKHIIKTAHGNIEILGEGNQYVAAGTHSSGVRYQWKDGLPAEIPSLSRDQVKSLIETLTQTYAIPGSVKVSPIALDRGQSPSNQQTLTEISDDDWKRLIEALKFLLPHVQENEVWSEVGYALLSLQNTRPIERLWYDFCRKAVGYEKDAPEIWWDNHRNQPARTDFRHIFTMARQRGMANVADESAFPPIPDAQPENTGSATGADRSGNNGGQPPASITPQILMVAGQYSAIIDQMESLLVPEVYVQGPHLVRQSQAHGVAEIKRKDDALMLVPVSMEWAKKRLGEIASIRKYLKSEGVWVPADLTVDYVNGVLKLAGWTKLRPLNAIARAPFVREDGSICDSPGYDNQSRVLYVPGTEYPAIPTAPDYDCARGALDRIRGVFDQFPWKEPASESAFLSHILAEAARLAIDRCPMYFYDAPSAGTGKGLLQEMAARIVHGSDPAIRPWVGDGDEIRKSLYASLLAGDRSLWFDNVPDGHKIRSPELCAFITSSTWKDRKLGESETMGVPNKVVLVASGNNITPVGDLARRSLVVRMDANTEKLKERVFKIPEGMLRPYVMEHRPQMLVDALTVIKAFHSANDVPKMPVALQSFGQWSHFCREPLMWLGFPDPVITQKETDDESGNVGNVYEILHTNFGEREFTCLDVARLVNGIADSNGELANALVENGCAEPNQPKKVGYWLRGCRDRISRGLKLLHVGHGMHGAKWRLKDMNEDLT